MLSTHSKVKTRAGVRTGSIMGHIMPAGHGSKPDLRVLRSKFRGRGLDKRARAEGGEGAGEV